MKKHLAQLSSSSSSSFVNPFGNDVLNSSSKLALLSSIALSTLQTNGNHLKDENLPQNSTDDDDTSGLSDDDEELEEEDEEELEEEGEGEDDDEEEEESDEVERHSLSIDPTEEMNSMVN